MKANETKELIKFIFDLTDAIQASLEDGKITLTDTTNFLKTLMSSGNAIGGIQQVPKELADLSDEDFNDLIEYVGERFDIENDQIEDLLEDALKYAGLLTLTIQGIYKLKK